MIISLITSLLLHYRSKPFLLTQAARAMSNFTLHVVAGSDLAPKILRLRLEYFVAAAVAVIAVLLLVTIAVAAMLVRVCRRKAKREKQERVSYEYWVHPPGLYQRVSRNLCQFRCGSNR